MSIPHLRCVYFIFFFFLKLVFECGFEEEEELCVVIIFFLDDAQSLGHGFNRADDFFLDEIETHCEKSDAEEEVERAESDADFDVLFDLLRRDEVAEADGRQRDETKVSRVEEGPLLPAGEHESTAEDVAHDQQNTQPDGHRFVVVAVDILVVRVGIVFIVDVVVFIVDFVLLSQAT